VVIALHALVDNKATIGRAELEENWRSKKSNTEKEKEEEKKRRREEEKKRRRKNNRLYLRKIENCVPWAWFQNVTKQALLVK